MRDCSALTGEVMTTSARPSAPTKDERIATVVYARQLVRDYAQTQAKDNPLRDKTGKLATIAHLAGEILSLEAALSTCERERDEAFRILDRRVDAYGPRAAGLYVCVDDECAVSEHLHGHPFKPSEIVTMKIRIRDQLRAEGER